MPACDLVPRSGYAPLLGLLLYACVSPPTLTLAATSSFRGSRETGARAHAWSAGAQLGWSVARRAPQPDAESNAAEAQAIGPDASTLPCAFASTCSWERTARSMALRHADAAFAGEPP